MPRSLLPFVLVTLALAAWPAPAPAAVYVSGEGSDQIAAFDRGASDGDGKLVALGPPLPTGNQPLGVAVSPDGSRVYVASGGSDSVGVWRVAADGRLTALPASAATGDAPQGIAISPNGDLLFSADGGGTVSAFTLAEDGSPVAVAGSPFTAGSSPAAVAVSPAGTALYVSDSAADAVLAFAIGPGGALTPLVSQPAGGSDPTALTIAPDGARLYVANSASDTISRLAVAGDGTLGPAVAVPAGGAVPVSLAITPDGNRLLAGLRDEDRIAVHSIGGSDAPAPVAGSPFATVTAPAALAVTPEGAHVYSAATGGPEIAAHSISAAGALAPLAGSPFSDGAAGHGFGSVAITPAQPPRAAFAFTEPTRQDLVIDFDASASTDPDGVIASYTWDFGDGTTATGGEPTVSHAYDGPGRYTATLSAIDESGCGAERIHTGQTALCNGGPVAVASAEVIVSRPRVLNPFVEVRPKQSQGRKVKVRVRAGAGEPVEAEARGKITVRGSKRRIRLDRPRAAIEASARKMLRLRPRTRAGSRLAQRLLDDGRALKAKVRVVFTDAPGNTAVERSKARLVPKG